MKKLGQIGVASVLSLLMGLALLSTGAFAQTASSSASLCSGCGDFDGGFVGSFNGGFGDCGCGFAGFFNSGIANRGSFNSGIANRGFFNSGIGNRGSFNSGIGNRGFFNSGIGNRGSFNSGIGNGGSDCDLGCDSFRTGTFFAHAVDISSVNSVAKPAVAVSRGFTSTPVVTTDFAGGPPFEGFVGNGFRSFHRFHTFRSFMYMPHYQSFHRFHTLRRSYYAHSYRSIRHINGFRGY